MAGLNLGRIVAPIFVTVGIALLALSASLVVDNVRLLATGVSARATVTGIHRSVVHFTRGSGSARNYFPAVRFVDETGATSEVTTPDGTSNGAYLIGDRVTVVHPPGQPYAARIEGFLTMWRAPGLLVALGAPFVIMGTLVWFAFTAPGPDATDYIPRPVMVAFVIMMLTGIATVAVTGRWRDGQAAYSLVAELAPAAPARAPGPQAAPPAPPAPIPALATLAPPASCAGMPDRYLARCHQAQSGHDACSGKPREQLVECFLRNPDPAILAHCAGLAPASRQACEQQYRIARDCGREATLADVATCEDRARGLAAN